jgi:hypothetical protein
MRVIKTAAVLSIAALSLVGCTTLIPQATDTSSTGIEIEVTQSPEVNDSSVETEAEVADLSDAEVLLAALMRPDGEYAAFAAYQAVIEEYGQVEPYATILQAEARHVDALIRQLERLGVDVPENPYLGEIAAPADLQTAAEAWAEGEILNVELYDYLITQTDNTQILKVLGNLRRASLESHLPAFLVAAENGGTLDSMPAGGHSN